MLPTPCILKVLLLRLLPLWLTGHFRIDVFTFLHFTSVILLTKSRHYEAWIKRLLNNSLKLYGFLLTLVSLQNVSNVTLRVLSLEIDSIKLSLMLNITIATYWVLCRNQTDESCKIDFLGNIYEICKAATHAQEVILYANHFRGKGTFFPFLLISLLTIIRKLDNTG